LKRDKVQEKKTLKFVRTPLIPEEGLKLEA